MKALHQKRGLLFHLGHEMLLPVNDLHDVFFETGLFVPQEVDSNPGLLDLGTKLGLAQSHRRRLWLLHEDAGHDGAAGLELLLLVLLQQEQLRRRL